MIPDIKPSTLIECERCGKVEFAGMATAQKWNVTVKDGIISGFLCHECQTDEEDIEAQVNESLIDYSKGFVDEQGRLRAPLKTDEAERGEQ